MYIIKSEGSDILPKITNKDLPKREIIEKYKNGEKVQENTVRALASFLGEKDWKNLVQSKQAQ